MSTWVHSRWVSSHGRASRKGLCNKNALNVYLCVPSQLDEVLGQAGTQVDTVFNFNIPDQVLVDRIAGRRVHIPSGRSYHLIFNPPKVDGKDDITGEELIQRKDDNITTLGARLEAFHEQTEPVIAYYRRQGKLLDVDANVKMDNVSKQLRTKLGDD